MPQMTTAQFAQSVRAKYPGSYDDLADDDLVSKVVAKHPEYVADGVVEAPKTAPAPAPSRLDAARAKLSQPQGDGGSAWDYVTGAARGIARAVGVPTSVDELKADAKDSVLNVLTAGVVPAANKAVGMVQQGISAYQEARDAKGSARTAQAVASGVPFVGQPVAAVVDPANVPAAANRLFFVTFIRRVSPDSDAYFWSQKSPSVKIKALLTRSSVR